MVGKDVQCVLEESATVACHLRMDPPYLHVVYVYENAS